MSVAVAAPSWVSATVGAWMLDEATGTRVNAQGTASRDLSNLGVRASFANSTDRMEGAASIVAIPTKAR